MKAATKIAIDAAMGRHALVKAAVDHMFSQTLEGIQSEEACAVFDTFELLEIGTRHVLTASKQKALLHAFNCQWDGADAQIDIWALTFRIGVEYGRRLAGGAR